MSKDRALDMFTTPVSRTALLDPVLNILTSRPRARRCFERFKMWTDCPPCGGGYEPTSATSMVPFAAICRSPLHHPVRSRDAGGVNARRDRVSGRQQSFGQFLPRLQL